MFCLPGYALADSSNLNLSLPSTPGGFQSDRVRADGLECQSAIGSSTNVEFGVVGIVNDGQQQQFNSLYYNNPTAFVPPTQERAKDVGVYARITIPIGAPKERLNCNLLYKLELEKKRIELMKLRKELEQMKALQFEK